MVSSCVESVGVVYWSLEFSWCEFVSLPSPPSPSTPCPLRFPRDHQFFNFKILSEYGSRRNQADKKQGIGFTLCGALGFAAANSGAVYQGSLATFWGSWCFLVGSVIQWYESLNKNPVEVEEDGGRVGDTKPVA